MRPLVCCIPHGVEQAFMPGFYACGGAEKNWEIGKENFTAGASDQISLSLLCVHALCLMLSQALL